MAPACTRKQQKKKEKKEKKRSPSLPKFGDGAHLHPEATKQNEK
jgi:hypothetical protein